ncbi:MAG: PHP domain-containing protein [Peptostreptococcales bacterium]
MFIEYDFHTHTVHSHGKGTIEDNVKVALKKGLKAVAITDHGPGHFSYGMDRKKIKSMREEIENLKKVYPNIEIKFGVEANIISPSGQLDIGDEREYFDFILAGYHYGALGSNPVKSLGVIGTNFLADKIGLKSKKLIHINTNSIIRALYENDIYILTHPGDKAAVDIKEVVRACVETDTLLEINNSHGHLNVEEIKIAALEENAKFIINSDAHRPEDVGSFDTGLQRALEAGLPLTRIINVRE